MITLRVLGTIDLRLHDDRPADGILRQPKRMALLAFLALERPRGFHRRDALLALFWPELDTARARDALNSSVSFLRRELGDDAVVSRGASELAVSAGVVQCDASDLEDAVAAGDDEAALRLYQGDLLRGFHADDVPGFSDWVDATRQRLRVAFLRAAQREAARASAAGDSIRARDCLRRALDAAPGDESVVRALMELLEAAGDRAGAIAVHDRLVAWLREEFDVAPSEETTRVAERVRGPLAPAASVAPNGAPGRAVDEVRATRAVAGEPPPSPEATPSELPSRHRTVWPALALLGIVALIVLIGRGRWSDAGELAVPPALPAPGALPQTPVVEQTAPAPLRVAVLPVTLQAPTAPLRTAAEVAVAELQAGILFAGQAVVDHAVVRAQSDSLPIGDTALAARLVRRHGVTTVVRITALQAGDSLRLQGTVSDARTGDVLFVLGPESGRLADPMPAVSRLRARLMGGVASGARLAAGAVRPPVYAAYVAFRRSEQLRACADKRPLLNTAIALDSSYVDPHIRLLTCQALVPMSDTAWDAYALAVERLERQRPQLSAYDQLRVDYVAAILQGDPDRALAIAERGYALTHSMDWAFEAGLRAQRMLKPRLALRYLRLVEAGAYEGGRRERLLALATAYHLTGDIQAERRALEGARAEEPGTDLHAPFFAAYAGARDTARVRALADSLLRLSASLREVVALAQPFLWGAAELGVHGDTAAMRRLLTRYVDRVYAVRRAARADSSVVRASDSWLSLYWDQLGNADSSRAASARGASSREAVNRALTNAPATTTVVAWARNAILAARWGDTAYARGVADSLGRMQFRWDRGVTAYWRATIVAELGLRDDAVALLRRSRAQGNSQSGWHWTPWLRVLRGYPPFERLLTSDR
jgi:DNA-binding SARP family transcriptional activator